MMAQYLLTIYQPDGELPPRDVLEQIGEKLHVLNDEIKANNSWVFTGGLHAPSSATVVRSKDEETLITDGPYLEGKEHIGGFWIVNAPDLDVAIGWAEKAARATGLPIEIRPFIDSAEY